jgi:hypothetical protein
MSSRASISESDSTTRVRTVILSQLKAWAEEHMPEVADARATYDVRS